MWRGSIGVSMLSESVLKAGSVIINRARVQMGKIQCK
jgi:hypothetical protein